MTKIAPAARVADDACRLVASLLEHDAANVQRKLAGVFQAIDALADNPLMGRAVRGGFRELVIGRDASGYLALYRYAPLDDTVYVLAIRSQREAGYLESLF
ncbi:plasmid stabilization protein [Xanthomonas oryzae]|uniref:type II toxin-antitoxin system RelE/ParE family toxin n=1 Tax=Xanthomonas oryzae TaxID=347 RepID=UPI0006AC4F2E|nr:type II toxin-antitoxin system RelE/ParE family toxin [Xanthomonas oryzae]ALS93983.1 plasmid stabilization protein [Xanthomonas oryzae pv. oryzae]AVU03750.1 type II toxin-antitoxin system RelE/ParE family toxin [Xanthomonas oryzae pv. oryzae]KOR38996.1 plasmid stabilization protein [Xanthomonas oryzae]QBI16951.1 type II toxin-antitoxin system RelE/ParE family toxin [Xanthomonas oryzae pv. oryzae]QBN24154.1 type II toxin-antitoxin system RelE/ParE family toxin [Xanthomonas oryzae pv. oryzae]